MCLQEFEVLTNETVGEACGDTDLIDREALLLQQHHTGEVLDIAFDGCLGMFGALFDLGELVSGEIEIEDLRLMCLSAAHVVTPAA